MNATAPNIAAPGDRHPPPPLAPSYPEQMGYRRISGDALLRAMTLGWEFWLCPRRRTLMLRAPNGRLFDYMAVRSDGFFVRRRDEIA
jgi:hypothetical protein